MTSILDCDLTRDAFLGGRVRAWQPKVGFRAGVDSVLLAAACPAGPGETVLELGCGVGVAALCLAARVTGAAITGLEVQSEYAALAARNGLQVVEGDVAVMPETLRQMQFHHVIFNPPYFPPGQGAPAPNDGRQTARTEVLPLAQWFEAAEKRLRAKGTMTVIQRAERLPDMLAAVGPTMGQVEVLPLAPRTHRPARLVILRAKKGARAPFRLWPPLTLHAGKSHGEDAPDYTPVVHAALHDGAPLPFPD